MKWFAILFLCFMVSSCGNSYMTHDAVEGLNTSIDALEASIPHECKTKSIDLQIKGLKQQANIIEKDCAADIAKVKADKIKWQTAFFGLLLVIGAWFTKKFII